MQRSAWPFLFAGLLVLTACGPDLGKQNFPRTTVTASAQSSGGEITDPAVALTALRTIDPCGLAMFETRSA